MRIGTHLDKRHRPERVDMKASATELLCVPDCFRCVSTEHSRFLCAGENETCKEYTAGVMNDGNYCAISILGCTGLIQVSSFSTILLMKEAYLIPRPNSIRCSIDLAKSSPFSIGVWKAAH